MDAAHARNNDRQFFPQRFYFHGECILDNGSVSRHELLELGMCKARGHIISLSAVIFGKVCFPPRESSGSELFLCQAEYVTKIVRFETNGSNRAIEIDQVIIVHCIETE